MGMSIPAYSLEIAGRYLILRWHEIFKLHVSCKLNN